MKDMGQSASRDALAPQINEPHQPAVSNSAQGGFTPGPWEERYDYVVGAINDPDWLPDIVCECPPGGSSEYWAANARLIAAAPDLLAAAKLALTVIGGNAARDELVAAIRRAEGQS